MDRSTLEDVLADAAAFSLKLATVLITIAVTGVLAVFKLIEGYGWSWWSVTSPIWGIGGSFLVVYVVSHSLKIAAKSISEEEQRKQMRK